MMFIVLILLQCFLHITFQQYSQDRSDSRKSQGQHGLPPTSKTKRSDIRFASTMPPTTARAVHTP